MTHELAKQLRALQHRDENAEERWFWSGVVVAAFLILGVLIYNWSGSDRMVTASNILPIAQSTAKSRTP